MVVTVSFDNFVTFRRTVANVLTQKLNSVQSNPDTTELVPIYQISNKILKHWNKIKMYGDS